MSILLQGYMLIYWNDVMFASTLRGTSWRRE
ncbi:hypothetical protein RDI58_023378 [Solanum bulbocastanum]|uniref:Uncharacterized protein n=1 Tax=Solanum bulbocastanum TaxID=147425 RepID=A0AAN8Y6K3_SOLBU